MAVTTKKNGAQTRHCSIYRWIEGQDATFAEALRDQLCIECELNAGPNGTTFLYPVDLAYRQEIVDKAYSNDADDAVKMVRALIIPDKFAQSTEFGRRPVGNKLGVALQVGSVSDGEVTFKNDMKIAPSDFNPLSTRSGAPRNLAVWLLTKGRAPTEGKEYAPPAPPRRFRGGGDYRGPNERARLADAVAAEYNLSALQKRGNICNPYLAKVVSLLNYLRAEHPAVLEQIQPVLDYNPAVSFYLLFEPYKTKGEHLIRDEILFGDNAWNCADAYGDAISEYLGFFTGRGGSAIAANNSAVVAGVDRVRRNITGRGFGRDLVNAVNGVYDSFAANNTIDGVNSVMSREAHAAIAPRKQWQDEFRFVVGEALGEVAARPYDPVSFCGIVDNIRTCWPGNDYVAERILSNIKDATTNVAPRQNLILLGKFVNSTDFLYVPVPPAGVGEAVEDSGSKISWDFINRNRTELNALRTITGMTRPSGLSPQTLRELAVYQKLHPGQLPAGLSA